MSLSHLSKLGLIDTPDSFRPLKFFNYEVRQGILKDILKSIGTDQSFHYQYKQNNLSQFEYLCHTLSEAFYLEIKDFELTRNTAKIIISWFISKTDLPPCLKSGMNRMRGDNMDSQESLNHSESSNLGSSPNLNKIFKKNGNEGEAAMRVVNQILLHFSSVFEMDENLEEVSQSFLEQFHLLLTTVIGFYVQFARTWAFKMAAPRNPPRDVLDISTSRLLFKITIGLVDYCLKKTNVKENVAVMWQKILHKSCAALLSVIFSSKDLSDESWNELHKFFKEWLHHPNIANVWSSVIFSLTEHIQYLSEKKIQTSKVMDIVKINLPGNEVLGVSLTEEEFFEFWNRFISLGNTILASNVLSQLNPESFYIIYSGLNQLCSKLIDMENNNILLKKDQVIISSNSILKLFGGWLMTGACFEDIKDIMHFKGRAEAISSLCRIYINDILEGVTRGDSKYHGSFSNEEIACILAIIEKRLNSDFFASSKLLFHVPQLLSLELPGIQYLLPNILNGCLLFLPEVDGADNLQIEEQQSVQMAAIENLKYLVPYFFKYRHLLTNYKKLEFPLNRVPPELLKCFKLTESIQDYFGDIYRLTQLSVLVSLKQEEEELMSIVNSLTLLSIENNDKYPQVAFITAYTLLIKIGQSEWSNNLITTAFYSIHSLLQVMQSKEPQKITEKCITLLPLFITNYKQFKHSIFACLYTIRKSFFYHQLHSDATLDLFKHIYHLFIQYSTQLTELQSNWDKATDNEREFKPYLQFITDILYIIHKQSYTMHYFQFGHADQLLPEIKDPQALLLFNKQWFKARQIFQIKRKVQATPSSPLFQDLQESYNSPSPSITDISQPFKFPDVEHQGVKFFHSKDSIISITQGNIIIRNRHGQFCYSVKDQSQSKPKLFNFTTTDSRTPLLHLGMELKTLHLNASLLEEIKAVDSISHLQTVNIFMYHAYHQSSTFNRQIIKSMGQSSEAQSDYCLSIVEDEQFRFYFYHQLVDHYHSTQMGEHLDGFYALEKISAFVYFESFQSTISDEEITQDMIEQSSNEKDVNLLIAFRQMKTKGLMKCLILKKNMIKKLNQVVALKDADQNQSSTLFKAVYHSAPLYHNCIVNVHKIGTLLKNTISMFEILDKTSLDTDRHKLIKSISARYAMDVDGPLQLADLVLS